MAQTPHMALDLLEQSQAQKEVTVNEAFFRLDAVLNSGAIDRGLDTPPGSPAEGDVYIIGASPTGLWSGKAKHVVYFHQIWRFIAPNAGLLLWVIDEAAHYVYNGTAWVAAAVSGGGGGGGSGDMTKAAYDGANINQQLVGVSASQTLTNKIINASNNTISNISLTSSVTGTLPLANGGTGLTSPGTSGNVLTSNGSAWVSQAPSGGGSAPLPGFRNLIINGDFRINQRGLTSVADDAYHLDRWYALSDSGNVTIAQQSDQEDGQATNIRMTQPDVSAKRIGIAQIIEGKNCKHLRGKDVFLSSRVRISASQAVRYAILEWTGTEDAVTSDVVNNWASGTYTPGNFFIGTSITVVATGTITPTAATWANSPSVTGTVSGSMNNLIVVIWTEGTLAQSATLDIGLVQLEAASAKTAFEYRSMQFELAQCLRYLPVVCSTAGGVTVLQAYSTTAAVGALVFPVSPRVAPTGLTISAASDFRIYNASGSTITVTSITLSSASTYGARFEAGVASGLVAGNATIFFGTTSNAKLMFAGAEL